MTASPRSGPPAVFIGLGGCGVQTISRLRRLLQGESAESVDGVEFLGVDAVSVALQSPPLPEGSPSAVPDYLDLTADPFIPLAYVRDRLELDPGLPSWWDPEYTRSVDRGPLSQGLKAQRMLGRLAVHRKRDDIREIITRAMSRALSARSAHHHAVNEPLDPEIQVYIVCSPMGGTGSAAFLEVVLAAWHVATELCLIPRIRPFIYLPSVLRPTVLSQHGRAGAAVAEVQAANSYAFFREVDHFCRFGSDLGRYLGAPNETRGLRVPDGELLTQIYLIENLGVRVGPMAAIYGIAAELLRDLAAPVLAGAHPVAPQLLGNAVGDYDEYDRPRLYSYVEIADDAGHPTWYMRDRSVAIHSLDQVGEWGIDYRRRSSIRAKHGSAAVPPSHIDRRFEADLRELTPNVGA